MKHFTILTLLIASALPTFGAGESKNEPEEGTQSIDMLKVGKAVGKKLFTYGGKKFVIVTLSTTLGPPAMYIVNVAAQQIAERGFNWLVDTTLAPEITPTLTDEQAEEELGEFELVTENIPEPIEINSALEWADEDVEPTEEDQVFAVPTYAQLARLQAQQIHDQVPTLEQLIEQIPTYDELRLQMGNVLTATINRAIITNLTRMAAGEFAAMIVDTATAEILKQVLQTPQAEDNSTNIELDENFILVEEEIIEEAPLDSQFAMLTNLLGAQIIHDYQGLTAAVSPSACGFF